MLLRFQVENHLSIRDRVELSMVASNLKDAEGGLLAHPAIPNKVVPSAIIYGANASGKSNLLSAFTRMRSMVISSHRKGTPDGEIPRMPFLLDREFQKRPTFFEVDFIANEIRYRYGFEASNEAFIAEWLYAYPNGRAQMLFQRDQQSFIFGRNLKGRNQTIADLTRKNSLFISAAAQNDHHELLNIYRFFEDIKINKTISVGGHEASLVLKDGDIDTRAIDFLHNLRTGVVGFRHIEEELPERGREFAMGLAQLVERVSGDSMDEFRSEFVNRKPVAIELGHHSTDGSQIFFNLDLESSGTRRLLVLLSPIFRILDQGGLLIVDELDASLHTHACEAVLALFSSKNLNKKGAQIIATTHDTNILRSTFIRRDQIWFCEKDDDGHSEIYPLTDIKLKASDNLEKGYLQGRFGAVPFMGSPEWFIAYGGRD
jgi:AAA15 family ATPase/GTPase